MVHKYQHFNPNTYRLDVKIAVVKSGFHCKCNIDYHLVWIPKYRKIVLEGLVKETLKAVLDEQCKELELEIMSDHLLLFVGAKPIHILYVIAKQLKGVSSIHLREQFAELAYLGYPARWKQFLHLWARGYCCGSAGHVSQEAVKGYLLEQEGKTRLSTASSEIR